jgi:hypothetical protein
MNENTIDPLDDGVTTINIWTKGKTHLGRQLSNLSNLSMTHPHYGRFACLEGYWFWLSTGKEHNILRDLTGFEARKVGKELKQVRYDDFQKEFKEGMYWRLVQHPELSGLLRRLVGYDQLELKHYYVYGSETGKQKVVDVTERHQWQLDFYKWWAELPENELLGQAVILMGEFTQYDQGMLEQILVTQLGARITDPNWAKHCVVGSKISPSDERYARDNFHVISETAFDDLFYCNDGDITFQDVVDVYLESQQPPKKYVVLKGEFETGLGEIIMCLNSLGYTVLSRPHTGDEPVILGDQSDPELESALNSCNVEVMTERHILNQEPS